MYYLWLTKSLRRSVCRINTAGHIKQMRRDIQFHSEEKLCLHLFIKGRVPSPWLFQDRTTASLVVNHNSNPWSCERSWHVLETRWMAIVSLVVLTFLGEPIIQNLSCSGWKNTPSTIPNQEASVPTDKRMCRLSVLGNLPRKEITLWLRWHQEIVELVSLIKNQGAGTASERDTRFLKPLQSLTVTVRPCKTLRTRDRKRSSTCNWPIWLSSIYNKKGTPIVGKWLVATSPVCVMGQMREHFHPNCGLLLLIVKYQPLHCIPKTCSWRRLKTLICN